MARTGGHATSRTEFLLAAALALLLPAHLGAKSLESLASQEFPQSFGAALQSAQLPEVPSAGPGAPVEAAKLSLGNGLNVYFVNVFQGDAEFIELPNGKTALIDAGPAPDPNSQYTTPIVASFLTQHGVKKIDYLVLTHPHADHYGGMPYVFDNLQVDNFYDTGVDNTAAKGDELVRQKAAQEPGCSVTRPAEGDSLSWAPGVQVQVLNTCPSSAKASDFGPDAGSFPNDCSIVLRIAYQGSSVLLTGDAGTGVEARLVKTYGDGLKSDILKVGHHGSAYSTSAAFLAAVQPKAAYIEVGRNTFGHPTQSTLDRLQAAGVAVHRTDRDGTQEVALGGASQQEAPAVAMHP
ncbi:MAG: ComEC/Rec2 family competence protein [Elusimicrobia bacterium]|nr:ComEC/Rec2 family competence protein [Elusimicrobiota bacterium]